MAKVIWTDPAVADLAAIYDYVAKDSQSFDRADQLCAELLAAAQQLERFPNAGALVEELLDIHAREIYRHGYRIIYVHPNDACYILQCIHSSRDLIRHLDPDHWDGFT
ncbi:MAG: type II toxin-antitoxin system RelE/ParE family toxin [Pirellulaceae bacterium]